MLYFEVLSPSEMALTLPVECFSLNKSISYYHFISKFFSDEARTLNSLGALGGLEQAMAHSSIIAWRIPRTEEPGRLESTGFQELDMT